MERDLMFVIVPEYQLKDYKEYGPCWTVDKKRYHNLNINPGAFTIDELYEKLEEVFKNRMIPELAAYADLIVAMNKQKPDHKYYCIIKID